MKRLRVLLPVVFCVLAALASGAMAAYQHAGDADTDAKFFRETYPGKIGTKLDNCALCHSGGSVTSGTKTTTYGSCQWCHLKYGYTAPHGDITLTLNSYGKDYLAKGRSAAALKAIEALDSDGDKFSNIVEINATRFPGDASDDPTKVVAPFRIYTKAQLQAMPQHKQFMLMNTTKSGDYYVEYSGVIMQDLLKKAGMATTATKITVYAPDGFAQGHPLEDSITNTGSSYAPFVNGAYPVATYFYNAEADKAKTSYGWCNYSSAGNKGRVHGDTIAVDNGLRLILALQADGKDLVPGKLGSDNKLLSNSEGPFRVVTPQKFVNAPDQASTATKQDVLWPYMSGWDHNAGFSSKSATIIKIEPLPAGTTDINVLEAGWAYIDQEKIVIYGALEQMNPTYPANGATDVSLDTLKQLTLTWDKAPGPDAASEITYSVEINATTGPTKAVSCAKTEKILLAGSGKFLCFGLLGVIAVGVPRRTRKFMGVVLLVALTGAVVSACSDSSNSSTPTSKTVTLAAGTTYSWRVTADGPTTHNVSPTYTFTTAK